METNYSKPALLGFLDHLADKGLANANTAQALKIASGKILSDISSEEEADVRKVDVPLAIRRFNNKNPNLLSPKSLADYQRRVAIAIREFARYTDNPTGYNGLGRGVPSGKGDSAEKKPRKREPAAEPQVENSSPALPQTATGLTMAFPLRSDFLAQVVLPRDLKTDEARRLAAFIATVAVDYKPD